MYMGNAVLGDTIYYYVHAGFKDILWDFNNSSSDFFLSALVNGQPIYHIYVSIFNKKKSQGGNVSTVNAFLYVFWNL